MYKLSPHLLPLLISWKYGAHKEVILMVVMEDILMATKQLTMEITFMYVLVVKVLFILDLQEVLEDIMVEEMEEML